MRGVSVGFEVVKLLSSEEYSVEMSEGFGGSAKRFERTAHNALKFNAEGRPVSIVSPERSLAARELEEYRRFFCKQAKVDRMNYVYFEGPVIVTKLARK